MTRFRSACSLFVAAILLLFAQGAAKNVSVLSPASPGARSIRDLFWLVFAVTTIVFLLVASMLIYSIVRFRERKDSPAGEPPQLYGSDPIEVAWTLAPLLTVFVLFLIVVRVVREVNPPRPPPGALHVTVVGHQWWWEYRYPDLGFTTAGELHVPTSDKAHPRPVFLDLESADVIHSFWVPRLAGKTDVIPGRVNHMWFEVREPDTFYGQCSEYCGTQHANMKIVVVAQPYDDFVTWAAQQKRPATRSSQVAEGRKLFLSFPCSNCHTIAGTSARGIFGPDLTHLMSRGTLASGMVPNDEQHLTRWVRDPQAVKPGCNMPEFRLTDRETKLLVAYLRTLR